MARQFGNQPSALANPVPSGTPAPVQPPMDMSALDAALEAIAKGGAPAPTNDQKALQQSAQSMGVMPAPMAPTKQLTPEELDAQINAIATDSIPQDASVFDQVKEASPYPALSSAGAPLSQRLALSFAKTDKEKLGYLQGIYGQDNVKYSEAKGFLVKKQGDSKFMQVDPGTIELIADALDFARPAVEGAIALPFEAIGALKGGKAGLAAGRAAGGAAATVAADQIAKLMGVPQDEKRNKVVEAALSGGAQVIGGIGGDYIGQKIAGMAGKTISKQIPEGVLMPDPNLSILKDITDLKNAGIVIEGGKNTASILPHQLAPDSPLAQQLSQKFGSLQQFREYQKLQGKSIEDGAINILKKTASLSGDTLPEIASNYTKMQYNGLRGLKLGENISKVSETLDKAIGKELGGFYDEATSIAKTTPQPLANANKKFVEILQEAGVKFDGEKLVTKPEDLAKRLGLDSVQSGADLLDTAQKYLNLEMNKGIPYNEMRFELKQLGNQIEKWRPKGGRESAIYSQLKSALRKDFNESTINILGGPTSDSAKAYLASYGKYGSTIDSIENLQSVLETKTGLNALANKIFAKENLGAYMDVKKVLADRPDLMKNLTGEYVEDLLAKNTANFTKPMNYAALAKDLRGLGDDMLKEMFGNTSDPSNLIKLARVGEQIKQAGNLAKASDQTKKNLIQSAINTVSSIKTGIGNISGALTGNDGSKELLKYMQENGIEQFLKQVPSPRRLAVAQTLNKTLDFYRKTYAGNIVNSAVGRGLNEIAQPLTPKTYLEDRYRLEQ